MDAVRRAARVAGVFDRAADTYENVGVPWFTPIAAALVQEVAPRPGERALDLGCGRGAALFPLADAVGPTGRVTGVDLSPRMVEATRRDVDARGLTGVELHVMDAGRPLLPAAGYQVAVSSLVLFFLPDPAAAVAAWRRLLVPGGRLGLSTFGARSPRWEALDGVFRPYLPPELLDARTSGTTGPFGTDAGVAELLRGAGYDRVRTTSVDVRLVFADAEQWRRWSWSHGQRAMWEAVPDADRPGVLAEAARLLEDCREPDGRIALTQRVRLTVAHRP